MKYLTLGAVDTTIKQFQGEGKGVKRRPEKPIDDESDMEDYDGPKIHNVIGAKVTSYEPIFDTSQKAVSKYYNPNAPQNWEVDWVGVASCFLSIRAPYLWGIWRPEVVDGYCEVVINFLNYVMMHGVCPEYTNDILAARRVAQKAKFELKDIEQIYKRVPGQFHYAMQVLADTNEWGLNTLPDEEDDLYLAGDEQVLANVADEGYRSKHLTLAQAEAAVRTTIGLLGTPEQRLVLNSWTPGTKFVATKSYNQGFEVLEIIRLNEDQLHAFSMAAYHGGKIEGLIDPHGILVLRPWTNPNDDMLVSVLDEYPHERKARERAERKAAREKAVAIANGTYVGPTSLLPTQRMFMDFAILKHFHVGMKIEARIAHAVLADGSSEIEIVFAERLMAVQASFFCPINNERMEYWKDPVETERDPPKSTDPEPGQEDDAGDCEVDD